MNEIKHEVITQGTPRLENMPKEVFNVFYTSLLCLVEDYYKDYDYINKEENEPEVNPTSI